MKCHFWSVIKCHTRTCASHIPLPFWIVYHSAYKLENRSVRGGEDETGEKIGYRGLVNLPHNHQIMPCSIIWGKKALNQLSLVSFFIINMKTARGNAEGAFLLKICSVGNIHSSLTLCSICKSLVQSASCIRTQHKPIILSWTH